MCQITFEGALLSNSSSTSSSSTSMSSTPKAKLHHVRRSYLCLFRRIKFSFAKQFWLSLRKGSSFYYVSYTTHQPPTLLHLLNIKIVPNIDNKFFSAQFVKHEKYFEYKRHLNDFYFIFQCRQCGQGVCDDCSRGRKPVAMRGWDTPVRVCDSCLNVDMATSVAS